MLFFLATSPLPNHSRARGQVCQKHASELFPGCVNDAGMSGNTSNFVFGPLALSVMVILTTPNTDPQWIGGQKEIQVWLLLCTLKKTLLYILEYFSKSF